MKTLLKSLRRHPGLNIAIVATLAFALTAAIVVSGLMETVMLSPLPHLDDRGVMVVEEFDLADGIGSRGRISWDTALDVRREVKSFSRTAVVTNSSFTVHGRDATEVAYVPQVSPEFFSLLRVEAALGDIIRETNAMTDGQPALMLSDSLWRRRFGADSQVVGRSVQMDQINATVVGVLPAGFELPSLGAGQQAWLAMQPEQLPLRDRNATRHFAFAELARGVSAATAAVEVAQLGERLQRDYPQTNASRGVGATPLREALLGPFERQLWILLATSVLVLLVACLNSGALLLAQALQRRREFAVRLALGARTGRLLRQFWIENLALTAIAAVGALLLATWVAPALLALLPGNNGVQNFATPSVQPVTALFAIGAALVAALVFGLMPWAIARRLPIDATLRGGGRSAGAGFAGRVSRWLVTGQIAVALALAIGAALLVASSRRLDRTDFGFPTEQLFQFRIGTRGPTFRDDAARLRFFEQARDAVAALPSVDSVSLAGFSYPNPPVTYRPFVQEGDGLTLLETPKEAHIEIASPEFLQTHDVRVLFGRFFTATDDADHPPVALVSAALADRYWPNHDAIGQRVQLTGVDGGWHTIVGVISDRLSAGHTPRVIDNFVVPLQQFVPPAAAAFVRFAGAQPPAFAVLQRAVWSVDPDVSVFFESRVSDYYAEQAWQQRFSMVLIGLFAALAVTLCTAGLYAVMAFAVAARTRELGVRVALGATGAHLRRQLLGEAGRMVLPGLALGVALAALASRGLSSLLFGVTALSPLVYAATGLAIAIVCLLASWLPARRAAQVDPVSALKSE